MAEFDTSMYGKLFQQGENPMGGTIKTLNELAQGRLLQNQNQLFQQEYKANLAIGKAVQGATGPNGTDWDKAADAVAEDPEASYKAGEFIGTIFKNKGTQLDNKIKQWDLFAKKRALYGSAALSAAQEHGSNVTSDDVATAVERAHRQVISQGLDPDNKDPDMLISVMAGLPKTGPEIEQRLIAMGSSMGASADALDRVVGSFEKQDDGQMLHIFHTNANAPEGQKYNYIGSIQKHPSPDILTSPQESAVPGTAAKITQTRGAAFGLGGGPEAGTMNLIQPQGTVAPPMQPQQAVPPPMAPQQAAAPPAQIAPPAQQASAAPPQQIAPPSAPGAPPPAAHTSPPSGLPRGAILSELPPADQEVLKKIGGAGGQYIDDLQADMSGVQQTLFMTHQLQNILSEWKPGAGTTLKKEIAEVGQFFNLDKELVDKAANGNLADLQKFEKYSLQNAANALRQQLTRQRITNMEFQQYTRALPNIDSDPRAATDIINNIAKLANLKRLEQAQMIKAYNTAKAAGEVFNPLEFENSWVAGLIKHGQISRKVAEDNGYTGK